MSNVDAYGRPLPASQQGPARGKLAGIKADALRAQGGGEQYNPVGVGTAWSHNFLNQKPWHPLNFRNQIRKFEAEQAAEQDKKAREKGQAEFDTEQEYFKTLSYLSPAEQQRYKEVQSVSFMYTKPPGYDAALLRDAEEAKKKEMEATAVVTPEGLPTSAGALTTATSATQAVAPQQQQQQQGAGSKGGAAAVEDPERAARDRLRHDPYTAMLAARLALANHSRLEMRGASVQEVHGGLDPQADNQQYLTDMPEANMASTSGSGVGGGVEGDGSGLAALLALPRDQQVAALRALARAQRKQEKQQQLAAAEAVLRQAGYDVDALRGDKDKHKRKHKSKSKKRKKKHKSSKGHERPGGSNSGSEGGSSSSDD